MLQVISAGRDAASEQFLKKLAKDYGVEKKEKWKNNNDTVEQSNVYIIDLKDYSKSPADIIHRLFIHNQQNPEHPLIAVPVAGWKEPTPSFSLLACVSNSARERQFEEEYDKSFSLSEFTTAKNADVVLRISRKAQTMKVFKKGNQTFVKVSGGVRITDLEAYLDKKGLALPPNMATLHEASLVGAAANGAYGPGKNYEALSTNIVAMKVINGLGERLKLSTTENSGLFSVLRDCHLGVCLVSQLTLANIQPRFLMKRQNVLYRDVDALSKTVEANNPLDNEHFLGMYIPAEIKKNGDNCPRIRITTFERTEGTVRGNGCRKLTDLSAYLGLLTTDAGERLIEPVVNSEELRPFFPYLLDLAALEIYGVEEHTTEVDWSPDITHIFRSYTELPISDYNWLIQVNDAKEGCALFIALWKLSEQLLKQYAQEEQYPVSYIVTRFLKGIYYKEGEGGIAPTGVDNPDQKILSFELLTFYPLQETIAFKHLLYSVIQFLTDYNFKYSFHPGKSWPDNLNSLTQIYTDPIRQKRLENFKEALRRLNRGKLNSPLLTPQKKRFIGLDLNAKDRAVLESETRVPPKNWTKEQELGILTKLLQLAEKKGNKELAKIAQQKLERK